VHHMGKEQAALAYAKANIDAWTAEMAKGLDAILITTSGCGTTIKDYGFMLREDPAYAQKAADVSAIARDISEYLEGLSPLPVTQETGQAVTYHAACSLQHGQQIKTAPKNLLKQAGFLVKEPAEGHLCCGSAGTYNMLQPEISARLRERKLGNIAATRPEIIAAGNIGCMTQLAQGAGVPIVHTVELLDWATGGPRPKALAAAT
jgi:glycolate oxidase iron-sulfur subunit